jgi:hypothetical protein
MMRLLIIGAILLSILGCGEKSEEKAAEKIMEKAIESQMDGKAQVDIDGENIKIKTADGEMTVTAGKSAKLPSGFPEDVFLYEDADLNSVMTMPQGYQLGFESKDAPSKISDAYLKEMTAEGWSKEMSMDMGNQMMLGFKKNERMVNVVTASNEDEKMTHIGLTVQKE